MNTPLLKVSEDGKTMCYKGQFNAIGLMPGPKGTCPYATTGKGGCWTKEGKRKTQTCYVAHCIALRWNVKSALEYNTDLLRNATGEDQVKILSATISKFVKREMKRDKPQLHFRFHWSGDIFDKQYANSLKQVVLQFPQVNFWLFTRSFPYAGIFKDVKNLSIYISLDCQNFLKGIETYKKNPHVKIAYLSKINDWEEQLKKRAISGMDNVRLTSCPVDSKKMKYEMSCIKCKMCLTNKKTFHIWFKTK